MEGKKTKQTIFKRRCVWNRTCSLLTPPNSPRGSRCSPPRCCQPVSQLPSLPIPLSGRSIHTGKQGGWPNKPDIPRTQSATLPCHPQGGSTAGQRTEQKELSSQCLLPTAPLLSGSVAHAGTPLNETAQQQGGETSCASARRHCEKRYSSTRAMSRLTT